MRKEGDGGSNVLMNLRRSSRLQNQRMKNYFEGSGVGVSSNQVEIRSDRIINVKKVNHIHSKSNKEYLTKSSIEKHHVETNHKIDWENTKVLWSENNPRRLLIKESLMIKAYESELDRTTHSVPLYIYPNGIERKSLPRFDLCISVRSSFYLSLSLSASPFVSYLFTVPGLYIPSCFLCVSLSLTRSLAL